MPLILPSCLRSLPARPLLPFVLGGGSQVFSRSVVLLLSVERETGALGLMLTHPLAWGMVQGVHPMVVKELGERGALSLGGPVVHPERAFHVLARQGGLPGFKEVVPGLGLYWGGQEGFARAVALVQEGAALPEDFWFFLGVSGWAPQQLEGELAGGSWYVAECESRVVPWPDLGPPEGFEGSEEEWEALRARAGQGGFEKDAALKARQGREGPTLWLRVLTEMGANLEPGQPMFPLN